MDKPPDDTAEQADICCELGVVLPPRMQFFTIYQKSSWLTGKKNVLHGPENTCTLYNKGNKKFELMLTRRAKAYAVTGQKQ